ncbi:MAG: LEA type 2 family protein [Polyangiaceae bacterium]|nr:LEA type 2 family protein [Polyangiaceae bacterium]
MRLNHAEINGVHIALPPSVGVVMTQVIDVYNPNPYDVAIRAMRGQVTIADKYTLPIDFRAPGDGLWLASGTTTTVRIPVTIPMPLALAIGHETVTSNVVPFRVIGKADVTATRTFQLEKDDYSVDAQGTFTRQQLQIALGGAVF